MDNQLPPGEDPHDGSSVDDGSDPFEPTGAPVLADVGDSEVRDPENWYIGTGGQVYGPVDVNTVREWAAQGRLRPGWQVRPVGGEAWFSPTAVPALADIREPSPPPPRVGAIHEPFPNDQAPPLGDVFNDGWELWKQNIWWGACVTIVQGFLMVAPATVPAAAFLMKPWNTWPTDPWDSRFLVAVACGIIYFVIASPVSLGLTTCFIDAARAGEGSFDALLSGFKQWGSVMIVTVVWSLLSMVPYVGYLVFLALPVYMAIEWALADRQRGIMDAVAHVRPLLAGRYWWVLGISLLAGLVCGAGVLLCGVGLLATVPIYYFITSLLYLHLAGRVGWTSEGRMPPQGSRLLVEVGPMLLITLALLAGTVTVYFTVF